MLTWYQITGLLTSNGLFWLHKYTEKCLEHWMIQKFCGSSEKKQTLLGQRKNSKQLFYTRIFLYTEI